MSNSKTVASILWTVELICSSPDIRVAIAVINSLLANSKSASKYVLHVHSKFSSCIN